MTIPACDDCGHSSTDHTVETGCDLCDCLSLLVISDFEAECHIARQTLYYEWMKRLGPKWSRRRRRHHQTRISN